MQRENMYRPLTQRMIDEGKAYRCTCTKEMLEAGRDAAQTDKRKFLYDRRCRDANHGPDCGEHVVRLKMPLDGEITFHDLVLGPITTRAEELDDWIIARSDGTPTYNFVVVADDHEMGITHVIRGQDHINNTPKQIIVYRALGYDPPQFAHMPLTHGPDGKKLSKRHGATSVMEFSKMGYMPEAMRNYLVRLGWGRGDQELFTDEQIIKLFDIKDITSSPGIMDFKKLEWVNGQKMMTLPPSRVAEELLPFMKDRGYAVEPGPWLDKLVVNCRERFKTLVEMADHVRYFFVEPEKYEDAAVKKWFGSGAAELLAEIADRLDAVADFTEAPIEAVIKALCEEKSLGLGKVAQPIRIAVTGGTVSPGIFEVLTLLGKERSLARLRRASDFAKNRPA